MENTENKFTIEKEVLLGAVKKVLPGVEKGNTTIDGADQILFTGNAVHSHNGEVAVTAPCNTNGLSFSVKGMDFYNVVSRLNDLNITCTLNDKKLTVKGGRNKSVMALLAPDLIEEPVNALELDQVEYKPVSEEFLDSVGICSISGNTDSTKGIAIGDYGDTSAIFAVDLNRVCLNVLSSKMESFYVDDNTFNEAIKVGTPKEYGVRSPWLYLRYEDGTVFSAHLKPMDGFPFENCIAMIEAIPGSPIITSGRLPNTLAEAVSRVSILASGVDTKNTKLVELTFHKDELELYAEKMGGEASETIPWETPLEGDPKDAKVWIDTAFLLEASNKAMDFILTEVDSSPAIVFKSGNYTHLVSCTVR